MPTKSNTSKVGAVDTKPARKPRPSEIRKAEERAAAKANLTVVPAPAPEMTLAEKIELSPEAPFQELDAITAALTASEPEALTVAEIAAMGINERLAVATEERDALRAWKAAGSEGEQPATPVLDWMHSTPKADRMKGAAKKASTGTHREAVATFDPAGVTEHACTVCAQVLPINKFPTTAGGRRGSRCRACRDAAKKA